MATEYVLAGYVSGLETLFAGEANVVVLRLENDQSPDKVIKSNTNDQAKNYILVLDLPSEIKPSALGTTRAEEVGSLDVQVIAPAGEKERVAVVRDLVERITAQCFAGIDPGLTITTLSVVPGPARDLKGVWWGRMMSISFFHAG
jgi:hypothetical protein